MKVFDSTNSPQGFKDDSDGIEDTEDDYEYDLNGNMTKDDNKQIESISYNHLNLPIQISFVNESTIYYLYNATGQKLKKVVTGSEIITTDYLSGFQYHNGRLKHFPHAEGYVSYGVIQSCPTCRVIPSFNYVFNFTDHLGNIRLSYSKDPLTNVLKIIEENHYYPFGLKHTAYNTNENQYIADEELNTIILEQMPKFAGDGNYNYKYNGKEYQDELGLNFYDYGARNYDPALGRWMNVDPLAEKRTGLTPYNFVQNNPLNRIDPDGALDYPIYGVDGTYLGDDGRTGGDLAFIGESDGKGGFINLSQFTDNHTQFQIISSIVKHEGVTNDSNEYLWIAHTANNASKESGKSMYSKLMSGYSSVPKSEKVPLSISDNSSTARFARAGVIDVMSECSSGDPTGGATLWDGTDFLAWGLNSPNGTPHNKFEEYKSISISGDIYNSFLSNTLSKYSSGRVRYSGKYYNIPSAVFTDSSNWSEGNFFYNTGEKRTYGLESTGTAGRSIFWKKTK